MLDPRVVENQLYRARLARIEAEEAIEEIEDLLGRVRRSWAHGATRPHPAAMAAPAWAAAA